MEKEVFRKHEYCKYTQYFAAAKNDDREASEAARGWTLALSFLKVLSFSLSRAVGN
jgi:hypothetical protein